MMLIEQSEVLGGGGRGGGTLPCATLYTGNPTWIGLGLNADVRGDSRATNCLFPLWCVCVRVRAFSHI